MAPFDIPDWAKALGAVAVLIVVALAVWWFMSNLASILRTLGIIMVVVGALVGSGGLVRKQAILGIPGGVLIAIGIAALVAADELSS